MKSAVKVLTVLLVLGVMSVSAYCDEGCAAKPEVSAMEEVAVVETVPAAEAPEDVSCEVVSVDAEKSMLVVNDGAGEVEVCVLPETKILKGEAILKLSDLKASDKVIIVSQSDDENNQIAESISVIE